MYVKSGGLQRVCCWSSSASLPVSIVHVAVQHGPPHQHTLQMREDGSFDNILCNMKMFARQWFSSVLLRGMFYLVSFIKLALKIHVTDFDGILLSCISSVMLQIDSFFFGSEGNYFDNL